MKILQVSTAFKPSWETGGTTRITYELSKGLINRNHEVTVYTTDRGQKRVNTLKNQPINVDGVIVYYFTNISNYLAMHMNIVTPYYLPFIARKKIKEYDLIHIHEHRTFLAVIVQYFAKKYNIPYVVQAHGSVRPFFQKETIKNIYDFLFGNNILKNASKVIAVSDNEVEEYKSMGVEKNKIEIVPNGINLSEFKNLPNKGEFRKNYTSLKNSEKVILYLGRIHKIKNIDLIIIAFADLLKELGKIKLVIIGPDAGNLLNLKRLIKDLNINDEVLFTGPVYERDKLEAYVDSDVFVSMCNDEIFGITFLEALASGTPVICSEEGGIADYINEIAGFSIDYDKKILKNKLIEILTNEELKIRFGNNGKLLVNELFNLDKIVNKFERIYVGLTKT
jgi:glycosyltransferase involved in cell wall biosynthesis